jgi:hypothetical protein
VLLTASATLVGLGPEWQQNAKPAPPRPPAATTHNPGFVSGPNQSTGAPAYNGRTASPNQNGNSLFNLKGAGPHRGDWLRKYFGLPPNQQEQQLEQDPAFRSLAPDKQQHLLNRLRSFNSQPIEKKQQILNRMETFEHMTPEQQKTAESLFQRYHSLPEDRRSQISQAYRRLRGMPPEQRAQVMNSDEFRNSYNEDERDLLRGMTDLNVGPSRPE